MNAIHNFSQGSSSDHLASTRSLRASYRSPGIEILCGRCHVSTCFHTCTSFTTSHTTRARARNIVARFSYAVATHACTPHSARLATQHDRVHKTQRCSHLTRRTAVQMWYINSLHHAAASYACNARCNNFRATRACVQHVFFAALPHNRIRFM